MLDAETKRRIGVLGTAALSSLAQWSTMLSPPTRLNTAPTFPWAYAHG